MHGAEPLGNPFAGQQASPLTDQSPPGGGGIAVLDGIPIGVHRASSSTVSANDRTPRPMTTSAALGKQDTHSSFTR